MATATHEIGRFDTGSLRLGPAMGVCALAAVATIPVFHAVAALLFLLAGVALATFHPKATATQLLRHRALLILPALCIASTIWSDHPAITLRHACQLAATMIIAILISRHLPVRHAILAVFLALLPLVLASILLGDYRSDTGALVGLFGSKNEMAGMSALLALMGFGILMGSDRSALCRTLGAIGCAVGLAAIVLAQSVGALGYLPSGLGAVMAALLLYRFGMTTRATLFVLATLAGLVLMISIVAQADAAARAFFNLTGKDFTLTGRLGLWDIAVELIRDRPWLGTGYQAFWVHGNPQAEALWDMFGIASRSGFNFHNTYLSNAVEIGVVGVAIQTVMIFGAVLSSGRLALATGHADAALFFGMSTMLVVVTLFEAPIFFQFNLQTVLAVLVLASCSDALATNRDLHRVAA